MPNVNHDDRGRFSSGDNGIAAAPGTTLTADTIKQIAVARAAGVGSYQAPGDSHGPNPPAGKLLAAYTNASDYTVSIVGGVADKDRMFGAERQGQIYITNSSGLTTRGGFFMGWSEEQWHISDAQWKQMSWESKAALETHEQATGYAPIAQQFRNAIAYRSATERR